MSTHLADHGYIRGSIDKTLFVKRARQDLIIAQIYVDDIVFGATSEKLVHEFTTLIKEEFEMSLCGKLNFFLGLQVQQKGSAIFISQSKYAKELVKKFGLETATAVRNPMGTSSKISADPSGKSIDQTLYRSMIGSLLYLTANRPDIAYSVGVCARYQSLSKGVPSESCKKNHQICVRDCGHWINVHSQHWSRYCWLHRC